MHDTAAATGRAFFECYGAGRVLDVGSMNVNGSLRSCSGATEYVGIDLAPGPGVDVVVQIGQRFPFEDASFDRVVSTSCFEHDPAFWITFLEMARVVKPGGYLYISAPSNGPYHGYPGDCWRFYADAASGLALWANQNQQRLDVIETFMMEPRGDVWIDNVMVFGKLPVLQPALKICDCQSVRNTASAIGFCSYV